MKIPFSPPYVDDDIKREVIQTLDSGWITTGPKVLALEKEVAKYAGIENVLCCNSATSGLMLALHWFGVSRGDEVIVPAYTYAATALAVMHLGAIPVMVDSGPDFNLDVSQVGALITSRTKAIIPVDIGGWPCDYDELRNLVKEQAIRPLFHPVHTNQEVLGRILILADAAHSIGARYNQQPAGSLADISVFSFHAVKNVTTGEGGAICLNLPPPFNNKRIYDELKLWSLNGQTKDAFSKTQNGDWKYDIVYPGFKMNLPDVLAAIGLAQMRVYPTVLLPQRKKIFQQYLDLLKSYAWAELPYLQSDKKESSAHIFPLRIRNISEEQRDKMIEFITTCGVSVNVHFQPLPLLTVFMDHEYIIEDYPVAYDLYSREISLPVYPGLANEQVRFVVECVVKSYDHCMKDEAVV